MTRRALLKILALGGVTSFFGAWATRAANAANPYYQGPKSPHFDGQIFFNPGGTPPGSFGDLLKWQLGGGKTAWPKSYPSPYAPAKPDMRLPQDDIRITMVGHATVLIQAGGLNFLTDPVWSERASPVSFAGPKRINPPGIAFEDLPPIDVVLLSHNHYDHMDLETLQRLVARHDPTVITPLGNDTIIAEALKGAKVAIGDWGDVVNLKNEIKIHFEPMHHWSARGSGDRRAALWAAFVIETPAGKIYHIGDTGFHEGINYRAVAEKHGRFRVALLPIGAYEPRWFMKGQHQNPAEAVMGHQLCNADVSLGLHWGTFKLTDEGIEAPLEALAVALEDRGVDPSNFIALRPGQIWNGVTKDS